MPVEDGRRPVIRLARDGLQSGDWQWAFVNSVPRFASASMCGVFTCGCPPMQPIQSFWSSMAMNNTFGRSAPAAGPAAVRRPTIVTSAAAALQDNWIMASLCTHEPDLVRLPEGGLVVLADQ